MTRTISLTLNNSLLVAMAFAVALCCLLSFAPRAQAAQLTEGQIQAIEGLLAAFNVDQATVATVDSILRYPQGDMAPEGEVLGTSTTRVGRMKISVIKTDNRPTIATAGSTGVFMGTYQIEAVGETMNLSRLGLKLSSGKASDLVQVALYSGTTLIGTATFTGSNTSATSSLTTPLSVPAGTQAAIDIRADLAQVGVSQPGISGDVVKIDPLNYQATGATSGKTAQGGASGRTAGVLMYRSYPTVSLGSGICTDSNGCNGANQILLRFSITASPAGTIGIQTLTASSTASQAAVKNMRLIAYSDASYSQPAGYASGQFGAACAKARVCVFTNQTPLEISAGSTYYFQVIGDVTPSSYSTTWAVLTQLIGDRALKPLAPASSFSGQRFIWSPNSTTTAGVKDSDWTNGYQVPGLTFGVPTNAPTDSSGGEVLGAATGPNDSNNRNTSVTIGGHTISVPQGTEIIVPDDYVDPVTQDPPAGSSYDNGIGSIDLVGFLQGLGINQSAPGGIIPTRTATSDIPPLPQSRAAGNGGFKQLYRYVSVVNSVNVYQDSIQSIGAGWSRDASTPALGYISPKSGVGLAALHLCVYTATNPLNGEKVHNYLSTTLSTCPPASPATVEDKGPIGYVWTASADYLTSVYTCAHNIGLGNARVTYSTLNASCDNPLDENKNNGRPAYYLSKAANLLAVVKIDANPTQVQGGDNAIVSWEAQNVASCAVTAGKDTLGTGLKGKKSTGELDDTTTFNLACAKLDNGFIRGSATVKVEDQIDATAPKLAMPSPYNNQKFRGTVYISANAIDPVVKKQSTSGVKTVTLSIDNKQVATLSSPPYGYVWDTTAAPYRPGTHTVSATAVDNAGNSVSLTRTVSVIDTPEPIVLEPLSLYQYNYPHFHETMSLPTADKTVKPEGAPTYTKIGSLGYITADGGEGLIKLSACLAEYNSKYGLKDVYSTNEAIGCTPGDKPAGTLGYIWDHPGDGLVPLYRCTAHGSYDPWWDFWGGYEVFFRDKYDSTDSWCGGTPIPQRGPALASCQAVYTGGEGYQALSCITGYSGDSYTYGPLPECATVPAGWDSVGLVTEGGNYEGDPLIVSCYPFKNVSAQQYYRPFGIPPPIRLLGYISATPALPIHLTLNVASSTVRYNGRTQVRWAAPTAGACSLSLNGKSFSTTTATVGEESTPQLTGNATVRLTCTNTLGKGSISTTTAITIIQPDEASCTLISEPKKIAKGEPTTLSWTTDNAADGRIDNRVGTTTPLKEGSMTVTPATTTLYTLSVHNKAGIKSTCNATTTVVADTEKPGINFIAPFPPPVLLDPVQLAGTTTVTVSFSDNVKVTELVLLDGTTTLRTVKPDAPAPGMLGSYSYVWNTTKVDNGSHKLHAVARDAAGNAATSSVAVDVENVKPPQLAIKANPSTIKAGATTTISWSAKNVASCAVYKQGRQNALWQGLSGSEPATLSASATYTLMCQTVFGSSATKTADVTVMAGVPKLTFSAKPLTVLRGATSTLTWSATNVSQCGIAINGDVEHGVLVSSSGSTTTAPITIPTVYSFGCQALNGDQPNQSVTIKVKDAPPPPPAKLSLSASPRSINSGAASTIKWSARNVSACGIFKDGNQTPLWSGASGTQSTGPLTTAASYTLGCQDLNGIATTTTITVTLKAAPPPPPPVLSITASPNPVSLGGSATITWSATNVLQCGVFVGSTLVAQGTSGNQSTGPLPSATIFTLGCQDLNGAQASKSVTVRVGSSSFNNVNESASAALSDLAAAVIMAPFSIATDVLSDLFVAVGIGQEPAAVAAAPAAVVPAKLSIVASPSLISAGAKTTISWSAADVVDESCVVSASAGDTDAYIGNGPEAASKVVLSQSMRFSLRCADLSGAQVTASVDVHVR